jgi:uncharacterized SAM-binding protein YcdF (DUF218 family)
MANTRKMKPGPLVVLLASVLILVLALVLALKPILRTCAYLLEVSQNPTKSDTLIVLGGGTGAREERAARLYQQGFAQVLIASGDEVQFPGIHVTFAQMSADYLVALGVPSSAIILLPATTSTRDEATQSLELAGQKGWTSLIVVTDSFHSLRAWLTFRQVYRRSGIRVTIVAVQSNWYQPEQWWVDERSLLAIASEYQKLAYYLFKGYLY